MLARLTFGNLVYLGAQFVSFLALAQLAPVSEVGRFSWALALTSPIYILADMRTRQVQLSTSPEAFSYRVFVIQRISIQLVAAPIAIILGILLSPDPATMKMVLGFVFLKFIEGLMNVSLGEHMRVEAAGRVAFIQVLRGFFYCGAFSLTVFFTSDASIAIFITSLFLIIPMMYGHFSLPFEVRADRARALNVINLTKESWSLGIGFFIGSVTINAPRFLVEEFHGVESLAVFTAVSYVIVLSNTVVDSVTQGLMPRFSVYWKNGQGKRALTIAIKICAVVVAMGAASLLISALFGDRILVLMYGDAYSGGQPILIALFTYATIQYVSSTLRSTLIAGGMRNGVLWTSVVNLIVTMGIAFLWVPVGSPESAAWSLACGQFIQMMIYVGLARKHFLSARSKSFAT